MKKRLVVQDLTARFEDSKESIFAHLNLTLHENEILGLIAPSGFGKSLLAKILFGLQPKDCMVKGKIHFFDLDGRAQNVLNFSPDEWQTFRRTHLAMIFQNPGMSLNPTLKIGSQLKEILKVTEKKSNVDQLLLDLGLANPERIKNAFPHQLSGGQLQRIIIAMAKIKAPQLLVADEPTTALDQELRTEILESLKYTQRESGASMLFISHDIRSVEMIADRTMHLGSPQEISYKKTKSFANAQQADHANLKYDHPALKFEHVDKSFHQKSFFIRRKIFDLPVLNDVSFTIDKGEVVGLLGPSGSGKSTIGNIILGIEGYDRGNVEINLSTKEVPQHPSSTHLKVQGIFQNPRASLTPSRTVGRHLKEAYQLNQSVEASDMPYEISRMLVNIGLDDTFLSRYPRMLSGGECQRIAIARAFLMQPEILICDEITSSLDPYHESLILEVLHRLILRHHTSVLFISHDYMLVDAFCDRIIKLAKINKKFAGNATIEKTHGL